MSYKRCFLYCSAALGIGVVSFYLLNRPVKMWSTIGPNSRTAYELSSDELRDLEVKAQKGDSRAALRIFYYYGQAKGDREQAIIWLKKSKALGNPNADSILREVYNVRDEDGTPAPTKPGS